MSAYTYEQQVKAAYAQATPVLVWANPDTLRDPSTVANPKGFSPDVMRRQAALDAALSKIKKGLDAEEQKKSIAYQADAKRIVAAAEKLRANGRAVLAEKVRTALVASTTTDEAESLLRDAGVTW